MLFLLNQSSRSTFSMQLHYARTIIASFSISKYDIWHRKTAAVHFSVGLVSHIWLMGLVNPRFPILQIHRLSCRLSSRLVCWFLVSSIGNPLVLA